MVEKADMENHSFRERQIAFCRKKMLSRSEAIESLGKIIDMVNPVKTDRFGKKTDFSALNPKYFNIAAGIATHFGRSKAKLHSPQDEAPTDWSQNPRYIMTRIIQKAIDIIEHEETGKLASIFEKCVREFMAESTALHNDVLRAIAEIRNIIEDIVFAEELEERGTIGILILSTMLRVKGIFQ